VKKYFVSTILFVLLLLSFGCGLSRAAVDSKLSDQSVPMFENPDWMVGEWGIDGELFFIISNSHILMISGTDIFSINESVDEVQDITADEELDYPNCIIYYTAKSGYDIELRFGFIDGYLQFELIVEGESSGVLEMDKMITE